MSFFRPSFAHQTAASKDTASEIGVVSFVASAALGGHRAVRMEAGDLVYADKDEVADANLVLGVTQGASSAGAEATVQTWGLMEESSWTWTPDLPIFVSNAGVLTQTPPSTGFSLIIAVAVSATSIYLGVKMPIILEI